METLKFENLAEYVLTNEEMINLRGGLGSNTEPPEMQIPPVLKPPIIIEI